MREMILQGRIALARARLTWPALQHGKSLEHFIRSLRAAFPAMGRPEAVALYGRHRDSMRQFALIKRHLSVLPADAISAFLDQHVQVEGQVHLDAVKDSAAPVIFVTPHYGNFAVACLKLIKEIGLTKTVNAFYNPPSTNRSSMGFEELFHGLGYGFHALFNDDTAVLKALRVLRRGEALTMMPDVFDIRGHALHVPFFGRLVPAMAGTALFALKSRATVIIGDLLADRLEVDASDGATWLANLESALPQQMAYVPEWPDILQDIKTMEAASTGAGQPVMPSAPMKL